MMNVYKHKIKERMIENGGRIVNEDDQYVRAIFPENKAEKAALIFLDVIVRLKLNAVLSGGYELNVFFY